MTSLVLELQREALDKSVSTADLLRKALVVARKLKVIDIVEWISNELNGYPDEADVPEYRILKGELKVHNPYHGWIPLIMEDTEQAEFLSKRDNYQPVSELEKIANAEGHFACIRLPRKIEQRLMEGMEVPLQPSIILSKTHIHGLLDRVRNTILEWALGLEERGVTGDGMSFSVEEQRQASNVTLHVAHVGNLIGSMHDSQIQQDTHKSSQSYNKSLDLEAVARLVEEIQNRLQEAQLDSEDEAQLMSDLDCIATQLNAPKPNSSIIKESLRSARSILEGVASSALFQGIVTSLQTLI